MLSKTLGYGKDLFFATLGCFLYSLGVVMFITPNEISPGGFTGIATSLGFLINVPSGVLFFILNIPIVILGFLKLGGVFIIKTAIASGVVSLSLEILEGRLPVATNDKTLASVFGGIIMGIGLSIVMLRGGSTGGVDIIAKLINRKYRHISVGKLILIADGLVIILASLIYKNISTALYSVVSMYTTSTVLDKMLYGADKGKIVYIISDFADKIAEEIGVRMERGVTKLYSKGAYTGKERFMLMCVLRVHEVSQLYKIVEKNDPSAFITVAEAGEILGEGFKNSKNR